MEGIDNKPRVKDLTWTQWWKGGKEAKLGLGVIAVDAKVFLPFLILLFHQSFIMLYTAIGITFLFALLQFLNIPSRIAATRVRFYITGRRRYVHNFKIRRRRFVNGE